MYFSVFVKKIIFCIKRTNLKIIFLQKGFFPEQIFYKNGKIVLKKCTLSYFLKTHHSIFLNRSVNCRSQMQYFSNFFEVSHFIFVLEYEAFNRKKLFFFQFFQFFYFQIHWSFLQRLKLHDLHTGLSLQTYISYL